MLYNVKTEETKNNRKWEARYIITDLIIVHDSLASDLLSQLIKDKTVKKIKHKGQTLTVYYDNRHRGIYTVDYEVVQRAKPVINR